MDDKKKYTKQDVDNYVEAVKREYEGTIRRQRERIDELKKALATAERKNSEYESRKELLYKAITAAVKKAEDIERVSMIKYNQEIAQLKSFHDKWVGYYNKIIEHYPLDDDLVATSRVNERITEVLSGAGDLDAQYEAEREKLKRSVDDDDDEATAASAAARAPETDEYTDRSPSGFSFAEALHPKDDLKDIMRELGVLMDDEDN